MAIANPYAGMFQPTPEQQAFLQRLRERQAQAREQLYATMPPAIAERLRNAGQYMGPSGQYTGPPLITMADINERFPGLANARQGGGSGPNPAAIWNHKYLQWLSGRGPHPGPNPITGQMYSDPKHAPPAQPGPPAQLPGGGLQTPPGNVGPANPPVDSRPPGNVVPGADIVDPRTSGPVTQNPTTIAGVTARPVGPAPLPQTPVNPALGSRLNRPVGGRYLDDLLGM